MGRGTSELDEMVRASTFSLAGVVFVVAAFLTGVITIVYDIVGS